jgi:hypothetical protein
VGDEPYRQAELEPLSETENSEFDLADERRRLTELFDRGSYAGLPGGGQIRKLLATAVPTGVIADLLAFNVLSDDQVALKQSLLAETRVRSRVSRIIESVEALRPAWRNMPESASLN